MDMTLQTFEKNLKLEFKQSTEIDFVKFILHQYYSDHLKSIQMAGDLGRAFGDICSLKMRIATVR